MDSYASDRLPWRDSPERACGGGGVTEGRASFWSDLASFGREILIVVIGVALGLWAQQVVSEAGWREAVKSAKHDFGRELQESIDAAAIPFETRDCFDAYLDRAHRIAVGGEPGPLPKLAGVSVVNAEDAAWQAAASAQVLSHLTHKELEHYAYAYTLSRLLRESNAPLVDSLAVVRTLDTPRPGRDPVVLQMQLEAMSRLKLTHTNQLIHLDRMLGYLDENLHIRPTAKGMANAREVAANCRAAATPAPSTVAPAAPAR